MTPVIGQPTVRQPADTPWSIASTIPAEQECMQEPRQSDSFHDSNYASSLHCMPQGLPAEADSWGARPMQGDRGWSTPACHHSRICDMRAHGTHPWSEGCASPSIPGETYCRAILFACLKKKSALRSRRSAGWQTEGWACCMFVTYPVNAAAPLTSSEPQFI